MHHVLHLIGRDDGMQEAHFLAAVTPMPVHDGKTMPEIRNVRPDHLLRMLRSDLQRDPFITVIKGFDGLRVDELEKNCVASVFPIGNRAENENHADIENENVLPNPLADFVGHIKRDEIRAAGGGVAQKRQNGSHAVNGAPETDIEKHVIKKRLFRENCQEKAQKKDLHQRKEHEPLSNVFCAKRRHWHIQKQKSYCLGNGETKHARHQLNQLCHSCKAAREQVQRV